MQADNKRIAKNTLFLYFRMLLITAVTLYTSRVVLEVLGVTDYGVFNVVAGFVSMLSFLNTSIANGFQRFLNVALATNDIERLKKLFSVSISIQLFLCIGVLVLAETVGIWFLNNCMNIEPDRMMAANWVYQCSVMMLIISLCKAPYDAMIIATERMDFFAYVSIGEAICRLAIVYLLIGIGCDKLVGYSILMLAVSISVFLLCVLFVRVKFRYISIRPIIEKATMGQLLSFSGWNLFGSVAHLLKSQGVNVLLNIFFGVIVNSARGIAYQIQAGVQMFAGNFQLASRPQIIKLYAADQLEEMTILVERVSKFSFFMLWIISLPLMLNIEFVLRFWLGDNVPPLTALFSVLSLLIAIVDSFANPITTIVHATGRMKKFQMVCSSIILMIIPISYVGLKSGMPPESAMYVSLAIMSFVHVVRLVLLKSLIPFSIRRYCLRVFIPCLSVVAISLPLSMALQHVNSIVQILLIVVISGITVGTVGMNKKEQKMCVHFIQQRVSHGKHR